MRFKLRIVAYLCCSVLMALSFSAQAALAQHVDDLFSAARFSSNKTQVNMPEAWRKQPIVYAKGVQADVVLSLDQQLYDELLPAIGRYAEQHKLKIAVNNGTCGISAGALAKKQVDIGGFCCPAGVHDRLPGLKWHTLGIAPIVLIVHADNPIQNVSLAQARGLFSGDIFRWKQVEAAASKDMVHPIGRLHCKLRPGHWRLLLASEDNFSPEMREVGAIPDMIRSVARDKTAIGYASPWALKTYQQVGQVHSLKIDGVAADALLKHQYPLYRAYNITSWQGQGMQNKHVAALIEYLQQVVDGFDSHVLISAKKLRASGWRFDADELVGEPLEHQKAGQ